MLGLVARIALARSSIVQVVQTAEWCADNTRGEVKPAIPEALRQYNALYALLVRQTLSDSELLAAAKR